MSRGLALVGRALLLPSLLTVAGAACEGVPLEEAASDAVPTTPAVGALPVVHAPAMNPLRARPRARVMAPVDAKDRVVLAGRVHPRARPEFDVGPVPPNHRMQSMMLLLRPDSEQEQALESLLRAQHDPTSPLYHQWLTPEMFAERFGISGTDVASTANWLSSYGMAIEQVSNGGRQILFSGTAGEVEAAFRTRMRRFQVDGELHHANVTRPEIPRSLAPVVSGIASLHDFRAKPSSRPVSPIGSGSTGDEGANQQHALVPGDLAKIYNALPLYASAIDGTGQTVAVLGRTNIDLEDVRAFRASFGLPASDPEIILAGDDPGVVPGGDSVEAHMDVEYAGAIAKNAAIKFVVARSTAATDGIVLASQYAVSHNVAPIISLSYGGCEGLLGTSLNQLMNSLWQQAAAQGMSVFVSSMDSGAAGCDDMNATVATGGLAVNGLGSTPFNTAVGGTQLADESNRSAYWSASNDPETQASALGYIPEVAWNDTRFGRLYSTGGGMSAIYVKPDWQFGLGVVADGKRDVPDVALAAGIEVPYKIMVDKQMMHGAGTSVATPVFASIMALVVQKTGQRQGLVNPILYGLAYNQNYNGGAAVFHDITSGNNTVPGVTGYSAGPGFDMTTGLGSVDATLLVNHWHEGLSAPGFQISAESSTVSVLPGGSRTAVFTMKTYNGYKSAIQFSVTGLPAGMTATFAPAVLSASGSTALTLVAAANATPAMYALTVVGDSGDSSRSVAFNLRVGWSFEGKRAAPTPTDGTSRYCALCQ